jgi:ABC-type branched-subunit amino acid transport system ATPase component
MKEVLARTFSNLEPFEIKQVMESLAAVQKTKLAEQRLADGNKVKKVKKASVSTCDSWV